MPTQVDIPGIGIVEFPDGMSNEQISLAIQRDILKEEPTPVVAPQAAPEPAAEGFIDRATTALGDIPEAIARGYYGAKTGLNVLGLESGYLTPEEAAVNIAASTEAAKQYAMPESVRKGMEEIQNAQGWKETGLAIAKNLDVIPSVLGESISSSAVSMGTGLIGGLLGAGTGSVVPGFGTAVGATVGLSTGVGAGSAATEYASSLNQFLTSKGVNTSDPDQLKAAFSNPDLMSEARSDAATRGIAVGVFDALSAGIAGRLFAPVKKALGDKVLGTAAGTGAEIISQSGAGAAGEATAQLATEGEITSPGAVALEAVGEIVPGIGEAAISKATGARTTAESLIPPPSSLREQALVEFYKTPGATEAATEADRISTEQLAAQDKAEADRLAAATPTAVVPPTTTEYGTAVPTGVSTTEQPATPIPQTATEFGAAAATPTAKEPAAPAVQSDSVKLANIYIDKLTEQNRPELVNKVRAIIATNDDTIINTGLSAVDTVYDMIKSGTLDPKFVSQGKITDSEGNEVAGGYMPSTQTIRLNNLDSTSAYFDPITTAAHEAVHHLDNLATGTDFARVSESIFSPIASKWQGGKDLLSLLPRSVKSQYGKAGLEYLENQLANVPEGEKNPYEVRAYLIGARTHDRMYGTTPKNRNFIGKVLDFGSEFVERFANKISGVGWTSAGDTLNAISSGKLSQGLMNLGIVANPQAAPQVASQTTPKKPKAVSPEAVTPETAPPTPAVEEAAVKPPVEEATTATPPAVNPPAPSVTEEEVVPPKPKVEPKTETAKSKFKYDAVPKLNSSKELESIDLVLPGTDERINLFSLKSYGDEGNTISMSRSKALGEGTLFASDRYSDPRSGITRPNQMLDKLKDPTLVDIFTKFVNGEIDRNKLFYELKYTPAEETTTATPPAVKPPAPPVEREAAIAAAIDAGEYFSRASFAKDTKIPNSRNGEFFGKGITNEEAMSLTRRLGTGIKPGRIYLPDGDDTRGRAHIEKQGHIPELQDIGFNGIVDALEYVTSKRENNDFNIGGGTSYVISAIKKVNGKDVKIFAAIAPDLNDTSKHSVITLYPSTGKKPSERGATQVDRGTSERMKSLTPEQRRAMIMNKEQFSRAAAQTSANVEEFKRWWKRSKAVDTNGEPKRFYTGKATTRLDKDGKPFKSFTRAGSGVMLDAMGLPIPGMRGPFYFSPDPPFANQFAMRRLSKNDFKEKKADQVADGGRMIPVFLSVQDPFDFDNPEHVARIMQDQILKDDVLRGRIQKAFIEKGSWKEIEKTAVQGAIRRSGFDGFYLMETLPEYNDNNEPTGNSITSKNLAVYDPKQIKGVFNEFAPGTAESEQFSRARALEVIPKDMISFSTLSLLYDKPNVRSGSRTLLNTGTFLRSLHDAAFGENINLQARTPANKDKIAKFIVAEALAALSVDSNAIGWYDRKLKAAKRLMALIEPEILTNKTLEAAFDTALAITSNGQAVLKNYQDALAQYRAFKQTGKFPIIGFGDAKSAMETAFEVSNNLIDRYGMERFTSFLNTEFTVRQLQDLGFNASSDELPNSKVFGSFIFGPKIGQGFYQNLRGNFDPLTMDRWFMRFWNRIVGAPFSIPSAAAPRRAKIKSMLSDLSELDRSLIDSLSMNSERDAYSTLKNININEDEDLFDNTIMSLAKRYQSYYARMSKQGGKPFKSPLMQMVGTHFKQLKGSLQEQPRGPQERQWIREVAEEARKALATEGVDINTADLQALVWYPEKNLWTDKLGVKKGQGEDIDYSDAAEIVAKLEGIDDEVIQETRATFDGGSVDTSGDNVERADSELRGKSVSSYGQGLSDKERTKFIRQEFNRELQRLSNGKYSEDNGAFRRKRQTGDRWPVTGNKTLNLFKLGIAEKNKFERFGFSSQNIYELDPKVDAKTFLEKVTNAANNSKYGKSVTLQSLEDLSSMRLFVSEDGNYGFAINKQDIVSVFADPDTTNSASIGIMELAKQVGGRKLDAFDTILPSLYASSGFVPVARIPFDDNQAPDGWLDNNGNPEKIWQDFTGRSISDSKLAKGRPDLVFMAYDPNNTKLEYNPDEAIAVSGYEDGMAVQNSFLRSIDEEQFSRAKKPSKIVEDAKAFATEAHANVGQLRKYTNDPYIVHPAEAVQIVSTVPHTDAMLAAAWLHDVVEDTDVTIETVREKFGDEVADLVGWLTDVSKPEQGNRAVRKAIDREHTAAAPAEAQTIKLADLISNTRSIVEYDKKFAKVYLEEKRLLLDVMTKGDATLMAEAKRVLEEGQKSLTSPREQFSRAAIVDAPSLNNLPKNINIEGYGKITAGPFKQAREAAYSYMQKAGLPYNPPTDYVKVDVNRAKRIADAYEAMADAPQDPEVKASYDQLIRETMDQWEAIKETGLKVEFFDPNNDPYKASPRLATEDVRNNNHLWVFSTDDGYGTTAITAKDIANNPMLATTKETFSGRPARVNDIFRVVHDYFGHIKEGVGFRADGEENAWRSHASMYSPLARRAMTSETRGQNSWLNYGPFGEKNRTAQIHDTVFADQKVGLMPEWTAFEGAKDSLAPSDEQFSRANQRQKDILKSMMAPPNNKGGIEKFASEVYVKDGSLGSGLGGLKVRFIQGLFDYLAPLKLIAPNAYKKFRIANNSASIALSVIANGPIERFNGGYRTIPGAKSLIAIIDGIGKKYGPEGVHLWTGYMAAKRSNRLILEGRESLMTQADIDEMLKLSNQYPEFETARKEWIEFNDKNVDFARANGTLTAREAASWKANGDYIPFYRALDDDGGLVAPGVGTLARQSDVSKKLKGSDKQLGNILENMILNTDLLVRKAIRNDALRSLEREAAGTGALQKISGITPTSVLTTGKSIADEIADHLSKVMGIDRTDPAFDVIVQPIIDATDMSDAGLISLFGFRPNIDKDVMVVRGPSGIPGDTSTKRYYKIKDPLLVTALTFVPPTNLGFMRLLTAPKTLFTRAITMAPPFMAANLFRDTLQARVLSNANTIPFFDTTKGLYASLRNTQGAKDLQAGGGSTTNNYDSSSLNRYKKLTGSKSNPFMVTLGNAWGALEAIGNATEVANRIAIREAKLKSGASLGDANFEALDIMDFSLRGSNVIVNFIISTVPFMNARLQGMYKLGRAGFSKENRANFLLMGSMFALASLGLAAMNEDDERYQEETDVSKDNYIHIYLDKFLPKEALIAAGIDKWTKDFHLALPKPFEIGAVFMTIPERMYNVYKGTQQAKDLRDSVWGIVGTTFKMHPVEMIPYPAKIAAEQVMNVDLFRKRDIVPENKRAPGAEEAEYEYNTPEILKAFSQAVKDNTGVGISPLRAEKLIRDFAGTFGEYFIMAGDMAYREMNGMPQPINKNLLESVTGQSRFIKTNSPTYTKHEQDFYNLSKDIKSIVRVLDTFDKENPEKAEKFEEANRAYIDAEKEANNVSAKLSKLRRAKEEIYREGGPDAEAEIKDINAEENELTKEFMVYFRELEAEY